MSSAVLEFSRVLLVFGEGQFFLTLIGSWILNRRWVQLAVVGFPHNELHVLDVHLYLPAVMHCQRLVLFVSCHSVPRGFWSVTRTFFTMLLAMGVGVCHDFSCFEFGAVLHLLVLGVFSELASSFSGCLDVHFPDSSLTLSSFRVLTAHCLELLLSLPVLDLFTSFHDSFRCGNATAGNMCTSPEVYALDYCPTGDLS